MSAVSYTHLAEYLEFFRCRYEEELEASQDDLKLIYIIDGIDELNSDTKEILNCLPTNEQLQQLGRDCARRQEK